MGVTLDDLLRPASVGLPKFRFRAHASFDKNPQFAAQVLRMLQTYNALEQNKFGACALLMGSMGC
ncbi:hypothetical protein [Umezakia ovalisporum]|uniref:hypothetical protein n=1 Tax=Umezakia ovalisporum TaxID=75695 RepID=UPI0024762635|nr:hypothetical protein [Umezakia ovalisporum]MDH6089293.1 hypothetical protein [Umezakia ovalisporum Ak1311]